MSMKFVLYDFLQVAGGAERVTLALARALPGFQVVVARVSPAAEPLLVGFFGVVRTLGGAFSRPLGGVLEAIACFVGAAGFLARAETVIYSGFYAPLAVHWQRGGRRIYYCHTPPRFAFELQSFYRARYPWFLRLLFDVFTAWLRARYVRAVQAMDVVLANSDNVRRRLALCTGVRAQVVYPPVDVKRFRYLADEGYFLSTARLEPLKRVEVLVRAFLQMPHQRLVVCSGGSELQALQALAGDAPNIHFAGWTSDEALAEWMGRARASIYVPMDEDFGMSPVESMAAGKPVIGVAEGGLLETVQDGQTGVLLAPEFDEATLVSAVEAMTADRALQMRPWCEARAQAFSTEVFEAQIKSLVF